MCRMRFLLSNVTRRRYQRGQKNIRKKGGVKAFGLSQRYLISTSPILASCVLRLPKGNTGQLVNLRTVEPSRNHIRGEGRASGMSLLL